eukprot:7383864-Prymnesium_polylepis.1
MVRNMLPNVIAFRHRPTAAVFEIHKRAVEPRAKGFYAPHEGARSVLAGDGRRRQQRKMRTNGSSATSCDVPGTGLLRQEA